MLNGIFNIQLGLVHEKSGNYDGAIENFRAYLQLAPSSADAANAKEIRALISI
ncbi:MAG: tetratricopeptide repeat protein [Syntrophaceae bacterium]|nr:tetratricopeptide repeat protein [Syntrophaceae bacterium]